MEATDRKFAGSIPEIYERLMVPLIFEPYALDLANRLARTAPRDILETRRPPPAASPLPAARRRG